MYSRTSYHFYLRLFVISFSCSVLSSCKYLELYKFSQQFCELDEYIELNSTNNSTNVIFHTPTLSRSLLLRYLGADPISSRHSTLEDSSDDTNEFVSRDHFKIERLGNSETDFDFFLNYHSLSNKSLLQEAHLDSSLSRLFSPNFVRPIVASFCTDDYEIEDEYVDLRFQLENIPKKLPSKSQLAEVFGEADNQTDNTYRFRFSLQQTSSTEKEIVFKFGFDAEEHLTQLSIKYYRYDYELDFNTGAGRLIATR